MVSRPGHQYSSVRMTSAARRSVDVGQRSGLVRNSAGEEVLKKSPSVLPEYAIAESPRVLAVAILSPPMSSSTRTAVACRNDTEGWGPLSRIRPFDLTSCFEEGAVFSPLLTLFLVLAVVACWRSRKLEALDRCRKSVWILRAKLVRSSVHHPVKSVLMMYLYSSFFRSRSLQAAPTL